MLSTIPVRFRSQATIFLRVRASRRFNDSPSNSCLKRSKYSRLPKTKIQTYQGDVPNGLTLDKGGGVDDSIDPKDEERCKGWGLKFFREVTQMSKRLMLSVVGFIFVASIIMASLPAPAQAAPAAKWRYQTMWAPSITLWRGDKYFSDLVNILAAGELEITYFPGGTLMTRSDEIFDAVTKGGLNMASDWPSYWEGKNTAFSLITSYPMWLTPGDYMLWFWQAGGFELSQELYAKYGIVWFPHSVTGPESGQRSNKPIRKGDDYKGVKMRQCGRIQAKILQDLGGAAIFMPGAEIYLALSRGTIDAGEFSVPECDWAMGFQEVTKYWVLPGWHQPGPVSGIMVNKASWDKLPDRTKFMFKEAAMATMLWSWTYFEYSSGEYTRRFKEKGITMTHLDQPTLDKIQDLSYNIS